MKANKRVHTLPFYLLFILLTAIPLRAQVAVKGETVYTMAGDPLSDGVVLVNKGKIEAVGRAADITISADYRYLSAKVVTPWSSIGQKWKN
jgi:imidazolonepropionase-like amidohydrolase